MDINSVSDALDMSLGKQFRKELDEELRKNWEATGLIPKTKRKIKKSDILKMIYNGITSGIETPPKRDSISESDWARAIREDSERIYNDYMSQFTE
jgi:hypothetical protein